MVWDKAKKYRLLKMVEFERENDDREVYLLFQAGNCAVRGGFAGLAVNAFGLAGRGIYRLY
jgi:hypothetical protein